MDKISIHTHKKNHQTVNCLVITISDTRTDETDKSGKLICQLLEQAGHHVVSSEVIQDEPHMIKEAVLAGCENPDINAILTNGGTGISVRDITIETIKPLLEKEIAGFGELFRMLSYQEDIGSAAMMSRAIAGVCRYTAIFTTPGSSGAVKLAMNRLILPELSHVIQEISKGK